MEKKTLGSIRDGGLSDWLILVACKGRFEAVACVNLEPMRERWWTSELFGHRSVFSSHDIPSSIST